MTNATKKHPDAELLHAIANGKEVQVKSGYPGQENEWQDCTGSLALTWITTYGGKTVRTKPERHVHQDLIDQYNKGAIIQYKYRNGEWRDTSTALGPMWEPDIEYRVKPEPKPDYSKFIGVGINSYGLSHATGVYDSKRYVPMNFKSDWGNGIKYETVNIIELVYDGESKQLKKTIIHSV